MATLTLGVIVPKPQELPKVIQYLPEEIAFGVRKSPDGGSEMVEYVIHGDSVRHKEVHARDVAAICIERFKVRAAQYFRSITFRAAT